MIETCSEGARSACWMCSQECIKPSLSISTGAFIILHMKGGGAVLCLNADLHEWHLLVPLVVHTVTSLTGLFFVPALCHWRVTVCAAYSWLPVEYDSQFSWWGHRRRKVRLAGVGMWQTAGWLHPPPPTSCCYIHSSLSLCSVLLIRL